MFENSDRCELERRDLVARTYLQIELRIILLFEEMEDRVGIILLGFGGVGQCFLSLLERGIMNGSLARGGRGVKISLVSVSDSKGTAVTNELDFNKCNWQALQAEKHRSGSIKKNIDGWVVHHHTENSGLKPAIVNVLATATVSKCRHTIVIDCSAADTSETLLLARNSGCSIVLANKKPVSGPQSIWKNLQGNSTFSS